jgi:hypothetical protein
MTKPKVNSVTWFPIYNGDTNINVYEANEDNSFFKVTVPNKRPKYFYGESAWSAVQRHVVDEGDFAGWTIFN